MSKHLMMRLARQLVLLLLAAVVLAGSIAPAHADAAKKKRPTACAAAKAKAKKKPTAARKRAVKKACRKPAKKCPAPSKRSTTPAPQPTPAPSETPAPQATPAPAGTPTSQDATPPATSALQDGVVACANDERAARGIAPLKVDPALTRAAQRHAADMAERRYFDHDTPEGLEPWDRIKAALQGASPFLRMGENIAMGYRDATRTCEGWMNSPGHKRNILDPNFTLIGAGWVDGYAVQDFGAR